MKRIGFIGSLFLLSFAAHADWTDCQSVRRNMSIPAFNHYETAMLHWSDQYNRAPSGSFEETYAEKQMKEAGAQALAALGDAVSLSADDVQDGLEVFAASLDGKYTAAASRSYKESVYYSALLLAWDAFQIRGVNNLTCLFTWRELLALEGLYSARYTAAPNNSKKEKVYLALRDRSMSQTRTEFDQWIESSSDSYVSLEELADELWQMYQKAPRGAAEESFAYDANAKTYTVALERVEWAIPRMRVDELLDMEKRYNTCYQAAPAQSRKESYCYKVRELARAEVLRRPSSPSNPLPPPAPPQPVPQPAPDPINLVECTLRTEIGTYTGAGIDRESAIASANHVCLGRESDYSCSRGTLSCSR